MASKVCTMCETEKPLADFWKANKGKLGYQSQCKDCQRSYRQSKRELYTDLYRTGNLKRKYNISTEEYDLLLIKQDYKCAICERITNEDGRRLAVDHDHATDRVRGILCISCNRGIGFLQDDPELLVRASDYLTRNAVLETT